MDSPAAVGNSSAPQVSSTSDPRGRHPGNLQHGTSGELTSTRSSHSASMARWPLPWPVTAHFCWALSRSSGTRAFRWKEVTPAASRAHLLSSCPPPFWNQGRVSWKKVFPWTGQWWGGVRMTQACCVCCALCFYVVVLAPPQTIRH